MCLATPFILLFNSFISFIVHYTVALNNVTCDADCGFVQAITSDTFNDLNGVPFLNRQGGS